MTSPSERCGTCGDTELVGDWQEGELARCPDCQPQRDDGTGDCATCSGTKKVAHFVVHGGKSIEPVPCPSCQHNAPAQASDLAALIHTQLHGLWTKVATGEPYNKLEWQAFNDNIETVLAALAQRRADADQP